MICCQKYCSDIAKKYGVKVVGINKLVQSLGNKSNYVVHYRDLQLYLSLGMKLAKINEVLKFQSKPSFVSQKLLVKTLLLFMRLSQF